ncbi:MAG TPA: carbohydrate kinase family protein [Candidatus Saccharimonadales bacterium]|nr:carbohydrate kinase family protein [Candidatus Saccharimonadales bacterium]
MKKILSIGEANLDSFVFLSESNAHLDLNKTRRELCIRYADKMLADDLVFSTGGNAANAAVAFARLGLESQLFSVLGDDWVGRQIEETLKDEKVDLGYTQKEEGTTSYATALLFHGEHQLIVYHVPRRYRLPSFEPADWVYLTSMGEDWRHAYERVLTYVKKTGAKVSFNPGAFQLKAGIGSLRPYLRVSDVLLVNRAEALSLVERSASTTVRQITEDLYELGPKNIVITDAAGGAYTFDGQELLHCQIFPSKVVERTGCGDSFGTAFTAALLHGEDIIQAMRWGMANSSSVIGFVGAQKGLLTRSKMEEVLNDNHRIVPRRIH